MSAPAPDSRMRWASGFSSRTDPVSAAEEVAAELTSGLDGRTPDLVLFFLGASHVGVADELGGALRDRLRPGCLMGASAAGVVSMEREVESGPGLSALAASLPGVRLRPFVMVNAAWVAAAEDALEFARCSPQVSEAELVLVLADPFSFDIQRCLAAFDRHAPRRRVVGGMASAGVRPGTNALVLNDWVAHEGGVGLALEGALRVDLVVSQGCRPVGPLLEVTRAQGNLLVELDGKPAVERTEQVLRALPESEHEFLRHGLYVGRPARSGAAGPGDWLIRNLLGADRDKGVLAVADVLSERERIRLHVRDAGSSTEDLEMLLAPQAFDSKAEAALPFLCTGRGRRLYGEPDRDIRTIQSALGGSVPAAGMFCAGEIGPIGERNLLHGHTASVAIVRSPTDVSESGRTSG